MVAEMWIYDWPSTVQENMNVLPLCKVCDLSLSNKLHTVSRCMSRLSFSVFLRQVISILSASFPYAYALSTRVWGRGEGCTGFWWGALRERDHCGDPDVDGRIILRWIFRKWEGVVGTGWSWLRIGTGGGHLWVRWWTFGFQKCGEFLD